MAKRLVSMGLAAALASAAVVLFEVPQPAPTSVSLTDHAAWPTLTRLHRPKAPTSWFLGQRMSAGEIPADGGRSAFLEAEVDDAPGVWSQTGPFNVGGRLTALAVDPNDPNRIWAGAAAGGVWLSTDGGVNWSYAFDETLAQSVGSLEPHPTDSNTLYVGGGEDNGGGYSYDGAGVVKTTDGGASWQVMGLQEVRRIGRIALDPVDPDRVFVAAGGNVFAPDNHRGVYRSLDGGQSWQQVLFVAADTGASDIVIDPQDPNKIIAAMWTRQTDNSGAEFGGPDTGIWVSTDGGDSWNPALAGLPTTSKGRIGLDIVADNPASVVYARWQNDTGSFKGVWRSDDAGTTWSRRDTSGGFWRFFLVGYGYYFAQIRVDPADPEHVYMLDLDWFESTDGAVSFQRRSGGLHVDHHDMIIEPGRLLMGNDGGFYSSTNNGGNWTHAETMPISQAYDIAIAELDPNRRFMGLQDNGTVRTTTGGTSDWGSVLGGDGLQTEVDPTDVSFVYASSQNGNIARSTDGGDSFTGATNGIDGGERTNWNAPVTHDPVTHLKLYTGTIRVYRSTDGAQSWQSISPDLTNGPAFGNPILQDKSRLADYKSHLEDITRGSVSTIGVSPVDTDTIWAGTDDGNVWVTDDAGANWSQVNVPGRAEWVTRVTADAFDALTAYATFTGFRDADETAYIFRTTDLGQTWQDIGGNLPAVPLNDVVPDPMWEGRLFAGSDFGVFLTDSDGQQWEAMSGGIPPLVIHDLVLHDPSRTLYAGTHARSLWTFDLAQLPTPDRDLDGSDNLEDCAPLDGGAFAVPGEITGVLFGADKQTLSWDSAQPSAGTATVHDVLKGALAELPVGAGVGEACLDPGTSADQAVDAAVPPAGEGSWYLVRGRNVCGVGTYGADSGGAERISGACP